MLLNAVRAVVDEDRRQTNMHISDQKWMLLDRQFSITWNRLESFCIPNIIILREKTNYRGLPYPTCFKSVINKWANFLTESYLETWQGLLMITLWWKNSGCPLKADWKQPFKKHHISINKENAMFQQDNTAKHFTTRTLKKKGTRMRSSLAILHIYLIFHRLIISF